MKTWKNLHERVCAFSNLFDAAQKAQRGKRHQPDVFSFNLRLEENLIRLQDELRTSTWEPGGYRQFFVQESKRRLISAAPYRDRVVHHAVIKVIEPLFDAAFIFDSYACRPGKGTHAAADRYQEFSRQARYVLQCDISRYFPSIRHDLLYEKLARKIADPKALRLLESIIRSHGDKGLLWPSGTGIPIGNLTSQFFANVFLNDFDHWVKETMRCRFYLRYVDDFAILSDDKRHLHGLIGEISERLSEMGLMLHPRKRRVFPVTEGCMFMGYRIWPDRRRLRNGNGFRFRRRLWALARRYRDGEITLARVRESVAGWVGHAQNADSWQLRRAIFSTADFAVHPRRNSKGQAEIPCSAGRELEQQCDEPALLLSQQQHADEP